MQNLQYNETENRGALHISDRIKQFQEEMLRRQKDRRGVNSALADAVSQVMGFMGEYTIPSLLFHATDEERAGYEEIRHDKAKVKDWAIMVYNRRFKVWIFRLKIYKDRPNHILDLIKKAKEGRDPQRLFNWLLKQEFIHRKTGQQKKTGV